MNNDKVCLRDLPIVSGIFLTCGCFIAGMHDWISIHTGIVDAAVFVVGAFLMLGSVMGGLIEIIIKSGKDSHV